MRIRATVSNIRAAHVRYREVKQTKSGWDFAVVDSRLCDPKRSSSAWSSAYLAAAPSQYRVHDPKPSR
jgi:hypothetical protein